MIVRKIPLIALQFIEQEEGLVLRRYRDPSGFPTICVGHLIKKGETFPDEMTKDQCYDILYKDLLYAAAAIMRLIKVPLSDHQYAALLSWTHNVGTGALQRSTLRSKLNRGEYGEVPWELLKWKWSGGRPILLGRRIREGKLFMTEDELDFTSIQRLVI